jgi:hypothetical protein
VHLLSRSLPIVRRLSWRLALTGVRMSLRIVRFCAVLCGDADQHQAVPCACIALEPQHIWKRSTPRLTFGTRYCCTRSTAGIRPSARSEHFLARSSSSRHDIIAVHPPQGLKRLKVDDDERVRFLTVAEETRFRDALVKRETNLRAESAIAMSTELPGTSPRCPRERLSTWAACGRWCCPPNQAGRTVSQRPRSSDKPKLSQEMPWPRSRRSARSWSRLLSRPRIDLLV